MSTSISSPIQGSLVAIVTPMHADGTLDLAALKKLIDWHIESGTAAIVIVGTTGESPTVDVDEHAALIKTTVDHAAGRIGRGGRAAVPYGRHAPGRLSVPVRRRPADPAGARSDHPARRPDRASFLKGPPCSML